jgi:hypothetical protein
VVDVRKSIVVVVGGPRNVPCLTSHARVESCLHGKAAAAAAAAAHCAILRRVSENYSTSLTGLRSGFLFQVHVESDKPVVISTADCSTGLCNDLLVGNNYISSF